MSDATALIWSDYLLFYKRMRFARQESRATAWRKLRKRITFPSLVTFRASWCCRFADFPNSADRQSALLSPHTRRSSRGVVVIIIIIAAHLGALNPLLGFHA